MSKNKTEDGEQLFSVKKTDTYTPSVDKTLTSAILDVFDFDMAWLEKEIKKVDWSFELLNPLDDYDFIKKINKNLVIL
jgi:hypothetical protein